MKYRELVRQLKRQGWFLKRQGANHEIWSNGKMDQPVPRHSEINELLAKTLLKCALEAPGKDDNEIRREIAKKRRFLGD